MKLQSVSYNNRKRLFEVEVNRKRLTFPYARLEHVPERGNPVMDAWLDEEFGKEAFSYRLKNDLEGSVHLDHVLEVNHDPHYMTELLLYRLSIEAKKRLAGSGLSQRELIRRLGTSASQYYRLLDPTYTRKSLGQLLGLLHLLGCDVDVVIKDRAKNVDHRHMSGS